MTKDWIMQLCPEISEWQAEIIYEQVRIRVLAEREACAKVCDEIAIDMWNLYKGRPHYKGNEEGRASDFTQGRSAGADDCAAAIRARSNATGNNLLSTDPVA